MFCPFYILLSNDRTHPAPLQSCYSLYDIYFCFAPYLFITIQEVKKEKGPRDNISLKNLVQLVPADSTLQGPEMAISDFGSNIKPPVAAFDPEWVHLRMINKVVKISDNY